MKPEGDGSPAHRLWSNLVRGKREGNFTMPDIADQMSFYAPGIDVRKLVRSLERVVREHQGMWKYSAALAAAWDITEVVLLHGDFSKCATPEALQNEFGFDVDSIVARWNRNREQRERDSGQLELRLYFERRDHRQAAPQDDGNDQVARAGLAVRGGAPRERRRRKKAP